LDKSNSYQAIAGGYPVLALQSITGVPNKYNWFSDVTAQTTLNKSIYRGEAIVVMAKNNDAFHAYYLKSYSNGSYYLFNPWGFCHLELTWDQLKTSATVFVTEV
jgi:hypothetical protein